MMYMKVGAIVLCLTMYQDPAFFANAAGTINQEEVQVTSVSIEWRQTIRIHINHIFYILYLVQLLISIREDST